MPKLKDLTGQKFGRLTVIERAENGNCGQTRWKCKCECGNTTIVLSVSLVQEKVRSCGCLLRKHSKSHSRLYNAWSNMKSRCYNPNNKRFSNYGGRGISVCDDWKSDFRLFYDWAIANGYSDDLTIDRIDVNGNYCPENCRWVDNKQQCNNRTTNHIITYNGKTQTLAQWAEELNIKRSTLQERIRKHNWDIEKALTKK